MIDETSMDRIIGEFFELNASFLVKRETSKLPKFISRYIWNKNKKDLLKNIEILRDSDYVLSYTNISELALYVFNNFDDKKYKSIKLVRINKLINQSIMEVVIKFDNIKALLEFPQTNRLDSHRNNKVLSRLNKELKNILCDYIKDSISLYE